MTRREYPGTKAVPDLLPSLRAPDVDAERFGDQLFFAKFVGRQLIAKSVESNHDHLRAVR